MKKISLLVAILLVATIGGVYATWNYAGVATDIGIHTNQAITLENAVQNGQAGTYTLTTNLTAINIAPNTQEDKIATLVPTPGNTDIVLTLKFQPTINAGEDIETNALLSYVYFGTEREFTWKGNPMFTFANGKAKPIIIREADETPNEGEYKWTKPSQDADYFICEITLPFEKVIAFAQTIQLPTIDDYNNFLAALGGAHSIMMHLHLSNIAPTV